MTLKFGKRTTSTAAFSIQTSRIKKGDVRLDPKIRNLTMKDKARKTILVNSKVTQIPVSFKGERVGTIVGARNVKATFPKPLQTKNSSPKSNERVWRLELNRGNKPSQIIGGKGGGRTTLPAIKNRARMRLN